MRKHLTRCPAEIRTFHLNDEQMRYVLSHGRGLCITCTYRIYIFFQGIDYLLCSLGDGALFYFQLTKQGNLVDKRKVILLFRILVTAPLASKNSDFEGRGQNQHKSVPRHIKSKIQFSKILLHTQQLHLFLLYFTMQKIQAFWIGQQQII